MMNRASSVHRVLIFAALILPAAAGAQDLLLPELVLPRRIRPDILPPVGGADPAADWRPIPPGFRRIYRLAEFFQPQLIAGPLPLAEHPPVELPPLPSMALSVSAPPTEPEGYSFELDVESGEAMGLTLGFPVAGRLEVWGRKAFSALKPWSTGLRWEYRSRVSWETAIGLLIDDAVSPVGFFRGNWSSGGSGWVDMDFFFTSGPDISIRAGGGGTVNMTPRLGIRLGSDLAFWMNSSGTVDWLARGFAALSWKPRRFSLTLGADLAYREGEWLPRPHAEILWKLFPHWSLYGKAFLELSFPEVYGDVLLLEKLSGRDPAYPLEEVYVIGISGEGEGGQRLLLEARYHAGHRVHAQRDGSVNVGRDRRFGGKARFQFAAAGGLWTLAGDGSFSLEEGGDDWLVSGSYGRERFVLAFEAGVPDRMLGHGLPGFMVNEPIMGIRSVFTPFSDLEFDVLIYSDSAFKRPGGRLRIFWTPKRT